MLVLSTNQGCFEQSRKLSLHGYFWSVVLLGVRRGLAVLTTIMSDLKKHRSPAEDDIDALNQHTLHLSGPYLHEAETEDGAIRYLVTMLPEDLDEVEDYHSLILAPAAFDVMKAIERYSCERGPLFVLKCHNPACGKGLFSARSSAVTCPRPPHSGRPSQCKTAWNSYRKWLQKILPSKEPEDIWDRRDLKAKFLAEYKPRGHQSGLM
jgi:hypothetical protein